MRTAVGILTGLAIAGSVLAGACWWLTQRLHPPPARFNPLSLDEVADYVAGAPPPALLVIALAAGVAAFVGAWPAARIARNRGPAALWVGAPLMALVVAGAALVPQPDWVPIVGMVLPIPLAVAAWRLAIPRREL